MASPICEREIESTMSDFSGQRLTGTANGGPSGRQGVPAVRVGWRMRLGMARRVLMDPPYAVPGLHTSPVPGSRETAWALAPQPPVTGIETNEQSQLELIKELDGLWDEVPDAPLSTGGTARPRCSCRATPPCILRCSGIGSRPCW